MRTDSAPIHDKRAATEYKRKYPYCLVCGSNVGGYLGLQVHHIIGGKGGRSGEPCNFMVACGEPCHPILDGLSRRDDATNERLPKIPLGVVLMLKMTRDPRNWNPERLAKLLMRALPELQEIPAVYAEKWKLRDDF